MISFEGLIWRDLLLRGLQEDGAVWDWTTIGSCAAAAMAGMSGGSEGGVINGIVRAKESGIWAAAGLCAAVNRLSAELGIPIEMTSELNNGQRLEPGQTVCRLRGDARSVLAFERHFLNLASYISGIATATRQLVDIIDDTEIEPAPRVTCTRKILPYYRDVAILGVLSGGGYSHRPGLSSGVLIKENHIAASGGIVEAIEGVSSVAPHGFRIEIEVRNLEELAQAVENGVDAVLLDNFSPEDVHEAVDMLGGLEQPIWIEVSGGINAETIADYAIPGVHVISVGALTHSVRGLDLSMLVQ